MDKKSNFQWLTWLTQFDSGSMDLASSTRKRQKTCNDLFFSVPINEGEKTVDKEQTFRNILFNNLNYSCTRKSTEQDIVKPKKGLKLGGTHDNLFFSDIFCCIKLSCSLKNQNHWWLVAEITCILCTQEDESPEHGSGKISGWHFFLLFVNQEGGRWCSISWPTDHLPLIYETSLW